MFRNFATALVIITTACTLTVGGLALNGCVSPGQNPNQPVTARDIYQTTFNVYNFNKTILVDVHATGGIREVTWQTKYVPKFAAADAAFSAWEAALDTPGSVDAQAKAVAAGAEIALLIIDTVRENAPAVQAAMQKHPNPQIQRRP
jgi:hypothetical protein